MEETKPQVVWSKFNFIKRRGNRYTFESPLSIGVEKYLYIEIWKRPLGGWTGRLADELLPPFTEVRPESLNSATKEEALIELLDCWREASSYLLKLGMRNRRSASRKPRRRTIPSHLRVIEGGRRDDSPFRY